MKIGRWTLTMALAFAIGGIVQAGTGAGLPVYPGATPPSMMAVIGPMPHCGHTMTTYRYLVSAPVNTVGDWYAQHISGGIRVNENQSGTTAATVVDPSGVHEAMAMSSRYGKGTLISLVTYDPPVPSSGMNTMRQAAAGNQAAMAKAAQGCGVL